MAILIDPTTPKDKPLDAAAHGSTPTSTSPTTVNDDDEPDESSPLLPPAYADRRRPSASHRASDLEDGYSSIKRQSRNRKLALLLLMLGLVAGALATAGAVLTGKSGGVPGSGEGSGEEWMSPPSEDHSASGLPNLNTLPSYGPAVPHDQPHPSYPGLPLRVRNVSFHLPVAEPNAGFFLHAFGEDAHGSVTIVSKPACADSQVVDVDVAVVYADEDKLKERVRIWEVQDGQGRHGVDIMTPRFHGISYRDRTDYVRIHVTVHVPSDASALSFEGMTTTMKLHVNSAAGCPAYRSFEYKTRNSPIEFISLVAETVKMTTTNARIGFGRSTSHTHEAGDDSDDKHFGLRATTVTLTTTNGPVDLSAHALVVKDTLSIKSTSGAVSASPADLSADPMDSLVIVTTNNAITGRWSAKQVKATTTNGQIDATFVGVERSLSAVTTNAKSTVSVGLASSAPSDEPIPVSSKTTNAHLSLSFLAVSPSNLIPAVAVNLATTNQGMSVVAPDFSGSFELSTSNAGVSVKGDRVDVARSSGGSVKGTRRAVDGGQGVGSLVGRTSNAPIMVAF